MHLHVAATPMRTSHEGDGELSPLRQRPGLDLDLVVEARSLLNSGDFLKWGSLALLVVQNSAVFVVTRYTRLARGRMYLASVVVLIVELFKLAICLIILGVQSHSLREIGDSLHQQVWLQRSETLQLAVPAICYTVQANLIFLAISNLSPAAAQVLYQMKTPVSYTHLTLPTILLV